MQALRFPDLHLAALFCGSLLKGFVLAPQSCKFRGGLPVAFDKKERWPEHYDTCPSCDLIVYPLRILHACHLRSPARHPRGFGGELLATVALVLKR
jgi:hypothetical protein